MRENLATKLEMKDFGKLKNFLGVKAVYYEYGIVISQRKCVLDFLREARKLGFKGTYILTKLNP